VDRLAEPFQSGWRVWRIAARRGCPHGPGATADSGHELKEVWPPVDPRWPRQAVASTPVAPRAADGDLGASTETPIYVFPQGVPSDPLRQRAVAVANRQDHDRMESARPSDARAYARPADPRARRAVHARLEKSVVRCSARSNRTPSAASLVLRGIAGVCSWGHGALRVRGPGSVVRHSPRSCVEGHGPMPRHRPGSSAPTAREDQRKKYGDCHASHGGPSLRPLRCSGSISLDHLGSVPDHFCFRVKAEVGPHGRGP
jgi:hypothetical protein